MNRLEREQRSEECITINDDNTTVYMKNSTALAGPEKEGFSFDRVFGTETEQEEIFDWGVKGIVEDVMTGFNGTLFCYGQTGSGKTYTMMGSDIANPDLRGLIPRIIEHIFDSIMVADVSIEYTVKVNYMEIYMERIKDLLAPQNDNLSIHEDKARGVYVKGLTDVYVGSEVEVFKVMQAGGASRVVAATNMNEQSSRSHSILVVSIHQRNTETGSQKNGNLYLVDLAGSEKVGKTGATGQTLEEAKKINKSLSALGMVINSLTDGKSSHVPYRDSKLTRILQESLGGNSRTTLIINCSPASYNEPETLSTLRFGMRAKSIKNKARVNVEMSPAELKALLKKTVAELAVVREHAASLEEEIKVWRSGGKVDPGSWAQSLTQATTTSTPIAPSRRPTNLAGTATPSSRSGTPAGLLSPGFDSRPDTPTVYNIGALDKDEREEFLKRENELSDQLAEKESMIANHEKLISDLKEELAYHREQENNMDAESKNMAKELSELRISAGRFESEAKDAQINIDSYKEKLAELQKDMDEQKAHIEELKKAQTREKEEEKEKRKQEMLNEMMSKIDMGGALDSASEKLRQVLRDIETSGNELGSQTKDLIRTHLAENQDLVRDLQERLRAAQEEADLQSKRRVEVEKALSKREAAHEELLGELSLHDVTFTSKQSILIEDVKGQYEAKHRAQEELLRGEIASLSQQQDSKNAEMRRLQSTIESYKLSNEELNRALTRAAAGSADGESFASSTQELERSRKAAEVQWAEFEVVKRSLMKDLQNRCEKVVELEMQLDEVREQYKVIARSANSRAQQRKLEFIEYNLEALNSVQKQLVEQNSTLKKEVAVAERKLMTRNDRIQNLEVLLNSAEARLAQKDQKRDQQMQMLRERLLEAQAQAKQPSSYVHGRIAKPLRGGGGQSIHQPLYPSLSSANPLQRVQQEETASGKRREFRFSLSHHAKV
ncbi:kinesin [Tremella mesenterica]|uniref:Kinesin n=1 Tax=Tremella mesenterica TaxID=5217 RepID=A0A4Q1BPU2_TREME|nr:kinesin [Tremella mesenterica]